MKKSYFVLSALALILSLPQIALADPRFRRPLNTTLSPAISAYYDHLSGTGLRTYSCSATNTYNSHAGTDFRASVSTPIYASAQGGLYYRYNGCATYGYAGSTCGGGYGNHAKIDHEGNMTDGLGWVTVYAHMKRDTVVWPMSILCGGSIGQTGSSGNSTGPHLHFEVKKYSYPNNDPYSGSCSHATTWWTYQGANGIPGTQCQ